MAGESLRFGATSLYYFSKASLESFIHSSCSRLGPLNFLHRYELNKKEFSWRAGPGFEPKAARHTKHLATPHPSYLGNTLTYLYGTPTYLRHTLLINAVT